jgi:uncharacterized integral membrane protein
MMTYLATIAFMLFFILLFLLLHINISEVSAGYHNKQSKNMPDTEE